MNSVIEKLAEIETTAEAIVEHAEAQKFEVEKEIQKMRDAYDEEVEARTEKELAQIRREGEKKMEELLAAEREKNQSTIEQLKEEFAKNHTAYAQEILKQILEV